MPVSSERPLRLGEPQRLHELAEVVSDCLSPITLSSAISSAISAGESWLPVYSGLL